MHQTRRNTITERETRKVDVLELTGFSHRSESACHSADRLNTAVAVAHPQRQRQRQQLSLMRLQLQHLLRLNSLEIAQLLKRKKLKRQQLATAIAIVRCQ